MRKDRHYIHVGDICILCVYACMYSNRVFHLPQEEHDHLRKQQEVLLKRLTQSDTTNEVNLTYFYLITVKTLGSICYSI